MEITAYPVDTNLMQAVIGVAGTSPEVTVLGNVADPAQGLNAVQLEFDGGYAVLAAMSDPSGLGGNTYDFQLWVRSATAGVSINAYVTDNATGNGSSALITPITDQWRNYHWTSLYPASSATVGILILIPNIPCTLEVFRYSAYEKRLP
jgi:hypothetical protein